MSESTSSTTEGSEDLSRSPSPEAMSPDELVAFLQMLERQRARLDGLQVRALASLARQRSDPRSGKDYASDEVAAALKWTPLAAARRVKTAVAMVKRLPSTVTALERGDVDLAKATAITGLTRVLDDETTRVIESRVLPFAVGRTVRQVRDKLYRDIIKLDPDGAEDRRAKAAELAFARFRPCPDGMAELLVYDTAERMRSVFDLLTKAAQVAKAAGATVGTDRLRAQALHDLVLGPNRERVTTELRVTVPASALAGASRQPMEIHGYGPTTIAALHELAGRNDVWRRIVTDPLTGSVLDVGQRRRHTSALGEHIRTRDRTCVFPGCPRPAADCQIDHTDDHVRGGATAETNLGALCQHHNLMKLHTNWKLSQPESGHFIWTAPTGATYEVTPQPVVDPDEATEPDQLAA